VRGGAKRADRNQRVGQEADADLLSDLAQQRVQIALARLALSAWQVERILARGAHREQPPVLDAHPAERVDSPFLAERAIGRDAVEQRAGLALCELGLVARQLGELDGATTLLEEALATFDPREKFGVVACLHGTALVASQRGDAERAAILFGAAHQIREELGAPIPPFERDEYDQVALRVQSQLGEAEFAHRLAEGRSLTVDAAITYARERTLVKTSPFPLAEKSPSTLGDKSPSPSGGGQGGGSSGARTS